jgi:hypothetical protein
MNIRNPQAVFAQAIKQGILSENSEDDNYAADWMYMGDDTDGKAMFKNIVSRGYVKAEVSL